MTLYLKYRPQKLSDLDLEGARKLLEKIFLSGNIPHAFLFAGPKGTGKTSAARIVAKILNCEGKKKGSLEPCNKCDQCLSISKGSNIDVIELDAASHRGIDDIRSLKEAIKLSPAKARKKVYIIDEAHMLTLEAANALLKTLEEPPSHAVFILATTNPEKIIETIKSRTTLVNFRKASVGEITNSLIKKAKGEKIKFEKKALQIIAKNSDGSFRDAAKTLEQLISEKISLTDKDVAGYYSKKGVSDVGEFLQKFFQKDEDWLLEEIERKAKETVEFDYFIEELIKSLHARILTGLNDEKDVGELVALTESLMDALDKTKGAFIEQLPLELAVIGWCRKRTLGKKEGGEAEREDIPPTVRREETRLEEVKESAKKDDPPPELKDVDCALPDGAWSRILSEVGKLNASVEALLRAAKPIRLAGNTLELAVYYKFHKERLEEIKQRKILEEVAGRILDCSRLTVSCMLTEFPKRENVAKEDIILVESQSALTKEEDEDIIKAAKRIFS
jgi:DNA polymerase-3 subunit gamma/tau